MKRWLTWASGWWMAWGIFVYAIVFVVGILFVVAALPSC